MASKNCCTFPSNRLGLIPYSKIQVSSQSQRPSMPNMSHQMIADSATTLIPYPIVPFNVLSTISHMSSYSLGYCANTSSSVPTRTVIGNIWIATRSQSMSDVARSAPSPPPSWSLLIIKVPEPLLIPAWSPTWGVMAANALVNRWAGWTIEDKGVGECVACGAFEK